LKYKYPEKYLSPLLLDQEALPKGDRLETTGSGETMDQTMDRIENFIAPLAMSREIAGKVQGAIRAAMTALYNQSPDQGKSGYVDIRLEVLDDKIIVSMRHEGKCGPSTDIPGGSCDIQHSQAIGFTTTTLTFAKA
jgi:hypothetical protein